MKFNFEKWGKKEVAELRAELDRYSDPEFADFSSKTVLGEYPFLGVRIPKLEEIAKEILAGNYEDFLKIKPEIFEEMELFAIVLSGKMKKLFKESGLPAKKIFEDEHDEIMLYVSRVNSWGLTDIFCSRMKVVKRAREEFYPIIEELLSGPEFYARTGLVMLLNYYVDADWISVVFEKISEVKDREEYYIRMAVAWLLQRVYVDFPDLTLVFMEKAKLPEWTLRKTVSKIQDSYRVDAEWKEKTRDLLNKHKNH